MNIYVHLCFLERKKIEKFLGKKSIRAIALMLDRGVSCISNEIKLGSVNGVYDAKKAEAKAILRRRDSKFQCMKVAKNMDLKKFVISAKGVTYINVADARIYPEKGDVIVDKGAVMRTLSNSKIIANPTRNNHFACFRNFI